MKISITFPKLVEFHGNPMIFVYLVAILVIWTIKHLVP